MNELQLHSDGGFKHLESLQKAYQASKKKLQENIALRETEKTKQLEALKSDFKKQKGQIKRNLY